MLNFFLSCWQSNILSTIMLGLVLFYLTFSHLVSLAIAQNVNTTVQKYSCVELRTIGQVFQVTPPLDVLARCAGLKIPNISRSRFATPTEHKKTRRRKRGGRRKHHVIDIIRSANLGHFLTRDLAQECVANNININNACVANNRNVNINNLVYIDCSNDFRERTPHFRISCINTQSCCNKTEMISDQLIEQDIDILCITETWLHE